MKPGLFQNLASAVRPKTEAGPQASRPAPSAPEPIEATAGQILSLPLRLLEPDPDQPRKELSHLDELAQSIRAFGVRQPILVRRHPEKQGHYRVIAGERRLRASQVAGLSEVPCLLQHGSDIDDEGHLRALQLVENLQRQDLSALETAQAIRNILDRSNLGKSQLAALLGKSPAYISKHLALLQAEGPGAKALDEGLVLSPETFRLLSNLPEEKQSELLEEARESQIPIGRGQVQEESRRERWSLEAASEPNEPSAPQAPPPPQTTPPPEESEPTFTLRLKAGQLIHLLRRLNAQVPEDPQQLLPTLESIL